MALQGLGVNGILALADSEVQFQLEVGDARESVMEPGIEVACVSGGEHEGTVSLIDSVLHVSLLGT